MSSAVNLCFVVFRFGVRISFVFFFFLSFLLLHFRHKGKRGSLKVRDSYHGGRQDATSWNGLLLFFFGFFLREFDSKLANF